MKKLFRYLLYILPLVLFFSYYPLIKLGENETMYFELSLPLLWLVVFNAVAFVLLFREKRTEPGQEAHSFGAQPGSRFPPVWDCP